MKIVMITGHEYPVGTALTNRIRSYLEALAAEGNEVSVIVYKPSEHRGNPVNSRSGVLNGVSYLSSALSMYRAKSPIMARLSWVYSYLNCLRILCKLNSQAKIDVIMQGSAKSSLIPFVYFQSRFMGSKYVLESCEYPWFILKKKRFNWIDKPLYLGVYFHLFDGVMAISRALVDYHQKYSKKSAHIMHLPMTVDMKRFELDVPRENLITYVGNVSYYKDGVGILVNAFILIADKHPGWNLVIIGNTAKDDEILKLTKAKKLEDRILLKGNVHRDEVPEMLCRSKILALARPSSLQSEGGFPTKLGEYLATGNLCVVTNVGEIEDFLQDNVSALISKPDSAELFAEKLEQAISKYDELDDVRKKGFRVCQENFNATVQGKRLDAYLRSII